VEHRLGRIGYLAAYVGTGVAAAAGDGLLRWGSDVPSVGASGAISGVLGFYFLWFPRNRVRVWVFLFPLFADIIELPARLVLGIYLVVENLLPLLVQGGAGGVSYGAHIGGFAAGFALAFPLQRMLTRGAGRAWRTERSPAAESEADLGGRFGEALDSGRLEDAARLFFSAPRGSARGSLSAADEVRLAEALEREGQPRAALSVYQRVLADHPRDSARAAAHLGAARVLAGSFDLAAAAYQHLYAVLEEHPDSPAAGEARAMLSTLEQRHVRVPRRDPRR
jgi:tetratricopeptide (TPR) repeat protein